VHEDRLGYGDGCRVNQLTPRIYHGVLHVRRHGRITKGDHFSCAGVNLGVGGKRVHQLAVKIRRTERFQVRQADHVRFGGFVQGIQGLVVINKSRIARVFDHGGALRYSRRTGIHHRIHTLPDPVTPLPLQPQALALDEAIAIGGIATRKLYAVNHAVAIEPMVLLYVENIRRVGSHPQEVTTEICRNFPDHFEIRHFMLFTDRSKVALKEIISDCNIFR